MPTTNTSDTTVSEAVIGRLVADGLAKEWKHPRTGAVRHYIDADGLHAIIGFEQTYYHTGNISGVHYVDGDGDTVTVAHSRGYHRDDKTFIEDGTVHCSWTPYGANIAELIARNLAGPAWTGGDTEQTVKEADRA